MSVEVLEHLWAMRESSVHALWHDAVRADPALRSAAPQRQVPVAAVRAGGIAVIRMRGVITHRPSLLSLFFGGGGSSVESLIDALRSALADREVSRIVLDIDSPGGSVDGVPELADEIYGGRARKPITALVDTDAASAAYWLASQASEVVVALSGSVGSIGIYGLHLDQSRLLDKAGITPTFVSAGKYKVEQNPLEPLTQDAKAAIQKRVDAFYRIFTRDVARGRGTTAERVASDFGEGRMVLAADAVARGMADRIGTLPSVLASPPALTAMLAELAEHDRAELRAIKLRMLERAVQLGASYTGQATYRILDAGEVHAVKSAIASAALTVACRDLALEREPALTFFAEDDGMPGERFAGTPQLAGDARVSERLIRLNARLDVDRLVVTVAHEAHHFARPHLSRDDDERAARDFEGVFAQRFWISPEIRMVNRHFLTEGGTH